MEVVNLSPEAVVVGENVRQSWNVESLEGLKRSIQEVGMLQPILVVPDGPGRYRLVAGLRRLIAARLLEEETIAAIVLAPDVDQRQVQLVENIQREDLNPVEKALAVKAFMDEGGMSKAEAARRLGVARTTLTDWLDVLEVEPRFQNAVIDNFNGGDSPLTLSHIAEAKALAARLGSPGIASVLLDAALMYKLTKAEIREVARMVRENREVSVRDAIRTLREMQAQMDLEEEDDQELGPAESNLLQLMRVLDHSERILARMEHLTSRFLHPQVRDRLVEGFKRLEQMAREAQERISAPPTPRPDPSASRPKKKARRNRLARPGQKAPSGSRQVQEGTA